MATGTNTHRPAPRESALGVYSLHYESQTAAAITRIRSRINRSASGPSTATNPTVAMQGCLLGAADKLQAVAAQRYRGKANGRAADCDIEDCVPREPLDRHAVASAICPWYKECGGCDLLGYTAVEQEAHLTNHLQTVLGE